MTIFDRAERSQRYLDALLSVPTEIGVHLCHELLVITRDFRRFEFLNLAPIVISGTGQPQVWEKVG